MRRTSRLLIAALFLQLFAGGVSAEAATAPLRINSVTVNGIIATVKWNPVKLTSKDFFEVDASAKALNLGTVIALAIKPKDLNIEDRLFILRDLNLYKFPNQILTNE